MAIELRWVMSVSASCLHAARAILRSCPLVEPKLTALAEPTCGLAAALSDLGIDAAQVLRARDTAGGANRAVRAETSVELAAAMLGKCLERRATQEEIARLSHSLTGFSRPTTWYFLPRLAISNFAAGHFRAMGIARAGPDGGVCAVRRSEAN